MSRTTPFGPRLCRLARATRLAEEGGHVLPRTIVSVLDSSDVVKDVAIAWALSLARWYESDLHVVHVADAMVHGLDLNALTGERVPAIEPMAWNRLALTDEACLRVFERTEAGVDELRRALGL